MIRNSNSGVGNGCGCGAMRSCASSRKSNGYQCPSIKEKREKAIKYTTVWQKRYDGGLMRFVIKHKQVKVNYMKICNLLMLWKRLMLDKFTPVRTLVGFYESENQTNRKWKNN